MEKKNKKVKKKSKANKIAEASILIIVALVIMFYIGNSIYDWIKQPTNVFLIEEGEVIQEESAVGYVIRNEIAVQGENYKNGILQIKTEGQRVSKGDPIFRYLSDSEESIKKEIAQIDEGIQSAIEQSIMDNNTSGFSSDIKLLENQIKGQVDNLYKNNNLQKIKEYKKEIDETMTKKTRAIGEISPEGSELRTLISKRDELENKLKNNSEYIKAPLSGIVSYRIDGLEEKLKIDDFSYLNAKFLENLDLKTGQIIAENDEKGKIINNFECYIATVLKSDQAKDARIGDKVKLILSNLEEITASISYINVEEDDSRTIVFKITNNIEGLIKYRKISFDIVWWNYKGWRVPNTSILSEDGKVYVIRNRAGYLDKILVKILRQNETYSILTRYSTDELKEMGYTSKEINSMPKISLYDEILINPGG